MNLSLSEGLKTILEFYPSSFNKKYIDRNISLAGKNVSLHFSSLKLAHRYFNALEHLENATINISNKDLIVYVLDASEFNQPNSDSFIIGLLKLAHKSVLGKRKRDNATPDHYLKFNGCAYYYSEELKFGLWVIDNLETLPNWHFASPLRYFWYMAMNQTNTQLSHMAAVSNDKYAVLLIGPSGAGKSSTALAAFLQSNLNILGDDLCIFTVSNTPEIYSLYNSIKIEEKKLTEFPSLKLEPHYRIENDRRNKMVYYFSQLPNDFTQKPIKALLKLEKLDNGKPILHQIPKGEMFKSLLLSNLIEFPGAKSKIAIQNHHHLTEKVDSYCMQLSRNYEKNSNLLRELLYE